MRSDFCQYCSAHATLENCVAKRSQTENACRNAYRSMKFRCKVKKELVDVDEYMIKFTDRFGSVRNAGIDMERGMFLFTFKNKNTNYRYLKQEAELILEILKPELNSVDNVLYLGKLDLYRIPPCYNKYVHQCNNKAQFLNLYKESNRYFYAGSAKKRVI